MKRMLAALLIITACNRWTSTTEIYQLRPDCWRTKVYVSNDGIRDTVRYRKDCPEIRGTDYRIVEPKWDTIYVD